MPTVNSSFSRDNNRIPITTDGIILPSNTITLTGSNTTVVTPIFTLTGTVEIRGIWGVVTTDLGSNHTAAYLRLNDQGAQLDITLNTGTALSAAKAGSTIVKKGLAAAAITLLSNSVGRVSEPTTLETTYFSPFVMMQKTAATTQIEYVYTTTNTPTTGAFIFYVRFLPVSADGTLTAV